MRRGALPGKEFIVTETGIPNPAVNGAGGEDVRKNYWIKAGVMAHINQVRAFVCLLAKQRANGSADSSSAHFHSAEVRTNKCL